MTYQTRRHLIKGLVGDRHQLYNESATFRYSIDALADMLPYWIDGIAAQAEVADTQTSQALTALRQIALRGASNETG